MDQPVLAPPLRISEWLNTTKALDLKTQRGHVVVACAFHMLCPGCVSQAIGSAMPTSKRHLRDMVRDHGP